MMEYCFDYNMVVMNLKEMNPERSDKSIAESLVGMRKFAAWIISLEDYEMSDFCVPGFVANVIRERPNCLRDFVQFCQDDQFLMKANTLAQTLKNISSFLSRLDQWYAIMPRALQQHLVDSREWQSSSGLARQLQTISTFHKNTAERERDVQNQIRIRREEKSHLELSDLASMRAVAQEVFIHTAAEMKVIKEVEAAGSSLDADVGTRYEVIGDFDQHVTVSHFYILQAMVLWNAYLGTFGPQRLNILIDLYESEIFVAEGDIQIQCCNRGKRANSTNLRHQFVIYRSCGVTAVTIWMKLLKKASHNFKEALMSCNTNSIIGSHNIFSLVKKSRRSEVGVIPKPRSEELHRGMKKWVDSAFYPAISSGWIKPIPDWKQLRRNLATNEYLEWRRTKGYSGRSSFKMFANDLATCMDTSVVQLMNHYIYAPILQTFAVQGDDPDVDEEFRKYKAPPVDLVVD
jgi:hypothetical protein